MKLAIYAAAQYTAGIGFRLLRTRFRFILGSRWHTLWWSAQRHAEREFPANAGYLAEIVLEFVIGGLLMRRIARPRDIDEYWVFIVRKTWLAGLLLMVVVAVVGYLIQLTNPEAKTLFQALH